MFAYIENDVILYILPQIPPTWTTPDGTFIDNFDQLSDAELAALGWHTVVIIDPPYDPDTQVKEGPYDEWDGVTATRTYVVRDMTPEELAATQSSLDDYLLIRSSKNIALIVLALVGRLLQDGVIEATDFTQAERDAYLDLKAIRDRIIG